MFFKRNNKKERINVKDHTEDFAILLKGASLDKLSSHHDGFKKCFIVSDYDDELNLIGEFLQGKEITHGELFALSNRIGHYYESINIGQNDRVALLSNNSIEHLIVYLASLAYGCTICTIHIEMNASHFDQILGGLGARLTLYESGHKIIEEALHDRDGEWIELGEWASAESTGIFEEFYKYDENAGTWPKADRADDISIFYTSGTSSNPKGVVCSYSELYDNTIPIADAFGISSEDRILDFRRHCIRCRTQRVCDAADDACKLL